jgi:lysophospholipase
VRIQEEYLQDPLCGQVFSNSAFFDLFKGLKFIRQKKYIKLMRKNLPIMIVSGQDDPVAGKKLIGPKKVFNKFKNLDYNVALKFYPEFRHEILNEFGKEEVEKDFLTFINQILKANRS